MSERKIKIRGAHVHNLRHVDLDLPYHKLIVFCGLSGSGKTSLALDTLYAEGQRRYIESFSAYTRQFLEQLDKPDAESIEGIPPAIAVTHKNPSRSNRATVGTETETNDYLALVFARIGNVVCHGCNQPVRRDSPQSVADELGRLPAQTRLLLGYEVQPTVDEPIESWLGELAESGYVRAVFRDKVVGLGQDLAADVRPGDTLTVVVDRLTVGGSSSTRVQDSVETVLQAGRGRCVALVAQIQDQPSVDGGATATAQVDTMRGRQSAELIDGRPFHRLSFSTALNCESCGLDYPQPEPQLFNFNSPLGACETCEGFGNVARMDMNLVVPDRSKTLRDGAIAPWNTPAYSHELQELVNLADEYRVRLDVPFDELAEGELQTVLDGVPEREFGGLAGFFRWLERRTYKVHLRAFLSRWRSYYPCDTCGGARLRDGSLAVKLAGRSFADVTRLKTVAALDWFEHLELGEWERRVAGPLIDDITRRLRYLNDVGVGYLELDRPLRTLSSGEAQRVELTTALGANLVDMLYVLDEPSIGLHPANVAKLADSICRLRDRQNTVAVVEHEAEVVRRADYVVEIGPDAGDGGGRVVFAGTPQELEATTGSPTGDWLAGRRGLGGGGQRRSAQRGSLRLLGARGHNLADISVEFPLGVLCLVTGVSGAGKSTLVNETLYPAVVNQLQRKHGKRDNGNRACAPPLDHDDLLGAGQLEEVLLVDPSPIGRSPRSNPVTYVKAFDPIRQLFADQPDARTRGFSASHFSFNVDGGRCEACRGDGYVQVDMQFMPDVFMSCRECGGRRFRRAVLDVKYRGRNIAEVLDMTAREAFAFFRGHQKVLARIKCLLDVGLDYLRLGQPANTLSGGEAQRLKLATYIAGKRGGRTLFILDEPTTGLHYADIVKLVDCFDALLDVGHSLIVVEHNLQLMLAADWLIDLGPGAAEDGGRVVATGAPEALADSPESVTGKFLSAELAHRDALVNADV